jgi:CubicO group peptidase (beta-lactamase class C family)
MRLRELRYFAIIAWLTTIGLTSFPVTGQPTSTIQGDFSGTLGPLRLRLHISAAADGTLTATLDSPNQGAMSIPCSDFHLEGSRLSFNVPSVHGSWSGSMEKGGATLSGTWTQGSAMPLTFTRDTFVPAAVPSAVDGFWLGTLKIGSQSLRLQISVKSDAAGNELCTLDSVDQSAFGLPCGSVSYSERSFSFDVPSVKGHWSGKLSEDGKSLSGDWTQRATLPLNFLRQEKLVVPPSRPPVTYSPAMAPVDAAGMQVVLDRDFQQALQSGALAPQTGCGVAIGVLRKGVRRVFAYGTAKQDSIFEIGSVTKTFTGLILAQLIEQGSVQLDQPVRELLPAGTVSKPGGQEISLLDLVTQHSGLPRLPDNFNPADPSNPYADYHADDLYRYIALHGVGKPADAPFLYSNLGFGLLGQALSNRAGIPYPRLLEQEITTPLSLKDTVVSLTRQQQSRLIQGHTANHEDARPWDLDSLAGAGAIRSTAADMLTYLEANLHPEKLALSKSISPGSRTLPNAIKLSHDLRSTASPEMHIAFAWLHVDSTGSYWHNGATGGYSSFVFFNPQEDYAAVVLVNRTVGTQGSLADLIGQHVGQRFAGKPAVSLESE